MNYSKYIRNTCLVVLIGMLPAALFAQGIHVTGGCRLIMTGSVNIVLQDASFNNEGFFTAGNGTLLFTGNQDAFISGNTTLGLNHVTINKIPGSIVNMRQDATVNGVLAMKGGNFLLNNQTLYLGNTASIAGESEQSHITGDVDGRIFLSRSIPTPLSALNPGNIGVELTSPTAPGLIVIERRHWPVELNPINGGQQSIRRHFNIASLNAPLTADIRFFYLDAELDGQGESGLMMWTHSDVSNRWSPIGNDGQDVNSNWVFKTGLGQWGQFTLANPDGGGPPMRIRPLQKPEETGESFMNSVRIYPNPSHDRFVMELSSKQQKDIVLNLYDQSGRLLQQKRISCRVGKNIISWNISGYAAGVYYIGSESNGFKNIKMIKQ